MKILIVNRALGTLVGGGESFDLNAARYLARLGHEVTIVTGKPLFRVGSNGVGDVDVVRLPVPDLRRYAYLTATRHRLASAAFYHADHLLFERRVMAWLSTQARFRQYDIVHHCQLFHLAHGILARWNIPVVSWLPGPPSGLEQRAIRRLMRRPGCGLFTRGAPVDWLVQQGLVEGRDFSVIEPGVELARVDDSARDREQVRRALGVPAEALLGVTVSRLVPVKNPALVARGLAVAIRTGLALSWVVIGDGPQRSALEQEAQRLGLSGRIRFLGPCQPHEVHRFLAAGDLFALTSDYENFSIATLEAMAHRLPVIATDVGYVGTLVRKSGGGLVVPPGTPSRLADAMVALGRNVAFRRELGERGRRFVEQFDWPRIAAKLNTLYAQVIEQSNADGAQRSRRRLAVAACA